MSPGSEQLIRDYITRLSGAARGRLDPVDRRALIHRTRDFIARKASLTRPETTMDFARLLTELGEPADLVDQEVRKLAALRDEMPPTSRSSARFARVLRHDSYGAAPPNDRGEDTKPRRLVGLVNLIPLHPNPQDHQARLFGRSRSRAPADALAESEDKSAEPAARLADADSAIAAETSLASVPDQAPDDASPSSSADAGPSDRDAAETDLPSATKTLPSAPAMNAEAATQAESPSFTQPPSGWGARASAPTSATADAPDTAHIDSAPVPQPPAAPISSTGGATDVETPSTTGAGQIESAAVPDAPSGWASTTSGGPSAAAGTEPRTRTAAWAGLLATSAPAASESPIGETSPSPRTGAVASLTKLRTRSVKATERLITGTFKWCQRCPLEATASMVLGVGGAVFPPVWLLGAALAFGSRLWDYRDRWLGLGGPVLLTIAGPAIVVSFLGGKYTLGHDVHLGWLYADVLARVSAVLGTSYLVWRSVHGRRPSAVPPWNKPRRVA